MNINAKYNKLEMMSACGATEDDNIDQINLGYEMYENFLAGRNLKYKGVGAAGMLPWLLENKRENGMILPPFWDHFRYFVDTDTKKRVVTIQPYLMAVVHAERREDFECEPLRLSKEFEDTFFDCYNSDRFKRLPDTSLVKESINAVLDLAKKASEEFASKHGLAANVNFNGWYNPERVILIEYRKAA